MPRGSRSLSWAAAFDLLMGEYGWTPDFILHNVTPKQAGIWSREISRRRRRELLMEAHAMRAAFAASFHSDNAKAFAKFVQALDPDADDVPVPLPGRRLGPHEQPKEKPVDEEYKQLVTEAIRLKDEMKARGEL